ncbi:hypothetical protein HG264_09275 [Pseudomonas sp. gcc21]|uniref:hypothetical protein n=1 Tax=Pseudomonas sp. gcc21 TaxID=2726989 RepID=UPI0014529D2F|nr:hypothetical protein [Pseudomonas sp. gcc21]QJD59087.1 hypothetical protein HG264_09275 [Pseudomonas sp. gcc21]
MSVNRRFVLKGMALGSAAALTLGGPAQAFAGRAAAPVGSAIAMPALVLVNGGAAEADFLHGAGTALGSQMHVQRVGSDLAFIMDFERQLRSAQPMRVIGLLDDASAALVVDVARSAGARIQWLGQHTAEDGHSRHRLLNTDIAEGCSRQLGRQLHACGGSFSVSEERQNSAALPRHLAATSRKGNQSGQWASSVGYLLASLGTRQFSSPRAPAASMPVTGSYVSFSIEA